MLLACSFPFTTSIADLIMGIAGKTEIPPVSTNFTYSHNLNNHGQEGQA
jgi:hypothetical protein